MKLLDKKEAISLKKKENDSLIESNLRLKKTEQVILRRMSVLKENYEPEKVKAYQDYEQFCIEINEKKSKLLKELKDIQTHIEEKKDVYYGLIEKQDSLEEKIYQMMEEDKKLSLRKSFVEDLERKWQEKQV